MYVNVYNHTFVQSNKRFNEKKIYYFNILKLCDVLPKDLEKQAAA